MNPSHSQKNFSSIPLAFGGASISGEGGGYGFGSVSEKEAENLIHHVYERGVRIFDTAPIYGFGLSEERLGKFLPKDAQVISKSGVHWHENKRVDMSNDPKITEKMLTESLRRLQREIIDVYMIHWPDAKVDIRKPLEVLKSFQEKGVIKQLGLCNTYPEDLKKAQEVAKIDFIQSEINLFKSESFEGFEPEKFITMSWGTFDKGILTGRVFKGRKFEADDCRSWAPWWNTKEVMAKVEKAQKLSELLGQDGISLKHFALQFNLQYKKIDLILAGSKTKEDFDEILNLTEKRIDPDYIGKIYKEWIDL